MIKIMAVAIRLFEPWYFPPGHLIEWKKLGTWQPAGLLGIVSTPGGRI
jgi:hypothetical protein